MSWVSKLEKELWREASAEPDKVPDNYRTAGEWGVIWERGRTITHDNIKALLKKGRMEMRLFNIQTQNAVRLVPHYRMAK